MKMLLLNPRDVSVVNFIALHSIFNLKCLLLAILQNASECRCLVIFVGHAVFFPILLYIEDFLTMP